MPGIIEPWKLASAHGHTCYSTWLVIILGQDTLSSDHEIKHYQCLTFPLLKSLCQVISLKLSCFYPVCVSIFNNIVLFQSLFFQLFYYYYFFFYFTILYWFCHTSTCIHHGCTRVPHPLLIRAYSVSVLWLYVSLMQTII